MRQSWARQMMVREVVLCLAALWVAWPVQAAPPAKSLEWVPDDVAFYSVMLRNREQIDLVRESHAWAKLKDVPIVKQLWNQAIHEVHGHNKELTAAAHWIHAPENKELMDLLADMGSEEIVVYGGASFVNFVDLMGQIVTQLNFGPALAQLRGEGKDEEERAKLQFRSMVASLAENLDALKAPEMVIGFRIQDAARAQSQLGRLSALWKQHAKDHADWKVQFEESGQGAERFLTLTLDGAMVKWDTILERLEKNEGEFEDLGKKLKTLKVPINLGVRDGYLFLSVGVPVADLGRLGGKKSLAERYELKPLAQYADRRLTSISYVSRVLAEHAGTTKADVDAMAAKGDEYLEKAGLPEEISNRITKDLKDLAHDVEAFIHKPGARLSFAFLTERGQEGYVYDWSERPSADGSKPLTILEHLGGDPLAAVAWRWKFNGDTYRFLAKWLKKLTTYGEDIGLPFLDEEKRERYQEVTQLIYPLLRRFDEATTTHLIPAFRDGQVALVVDAKLKSRAWVQAMPPAASPLPMLELAKVGSLSDAELFKQACGEYRKIANDALAACRQLGAPIPEFEIPPPETESTTSGTLYYFSIPAAKRIGLDPRIVPTAGLSKTYYVQAFSHEHVERLLAATPLKTKSAPLGKSGEPLESVGIVSFSGLFDVAQAWVDYGMRLEAKSKDRDDDDAPGPIEDRLKQAHTLFDVARVLRSYTSVTYRAGDAWVTHGELVIEDTK